MRMNVLIIGSGGRCHAIIDSLSKSPRVEQIYCAPGNVGIASKAKCIPIKETQVEELSNFAIDNKIDLTIVGPEASLAAGIADLFQSKGLRIFGPTKAAARIESSKEFAKALMVKYGIPTASYQSFDKYEDALAYVQKGTFPTVIKFDGLAAGKGVVIASDLAEADEALKAMLRERKFGDGKVVIEEYLTGQEFSCLCFVNGHKVYPMPFSQDHKRAFDGDEGPNTGGMGAYTRLPFINKEDVAFAIEKIMQPAADALVAEGCPFCGVLYGGLMKTPNGIKVIEFNARFGDPETEVILPLLKSDICAIFNDVLDGKEPQIEWEDAATLGIVLASKGYPGSYEKGYVIEGLEDVDGVVYHMGTALKDGKVVTAGGRVAIVVCKAPNLEAARQKARVEVEKVKCPNLFHRNDIGNKAF